MQRIRIIKRLAGKEPFALKPVSIDGGSRIGIKEDKARDHRDEGDPESHSQTIAQDTLA